MKIFHDSSILIARSSHICRPQPKILDANNASHSKHSKPRRQGKPQWNPLPTQLDQPPRASHPGQGFGRVSSFFLESFLPSAPGHIPADAMAETSLAHCNCAVHGANFDRLPKGSVLEKPPAISTLTRSTHDHPLRPRRAWISLMLAWEKCSTGASVASSPI